MAGLANIGKTLLMGFGGKKLYDTVQGSPNAALPALPTPLAAPTVDQQAQADAALRARRRMGLSVPAKNGTLLTGPSGIAAPATTQRATLLGGP